MDAGVPSWPAVGSGLGWASALCGFATSPSVLIFGRLLQGISAAVMAPQSLASIHALFPASEKARALGLYGATFGLASVADSFWVGCLYPLIFGIWAGAASS